MARLSLDTVQLGGLSNDMAGDLCCNARGIRWGLRDRRGHAAQSKPQPVRSLRGGTIWFPIQNRLDRGNKLALTSREHLTADWARDRLYA